MIWPANTTEQDILHAADGIDDISLDERWESQPEGFEFADELALAIYLLAGEGRFDGSYARTGDTGPRSIRIGRFLAIVDEPAAYVSSRTYATDTEAAEQAAEVIQRMEVAGWYEDIAPKISSANYILNNYYRTQGDHPQMSDPERCDVIDRLADALGYDRTRT